MVIQVSMPKLGLLMSEGTIVEWLAADRQYVEADQPIVHIISRKITCEVVAPASGILYHAAQVNDKVQIGNPLAFIASPQEAPPIFPRKTIIQVPYPVKDKSAGRQAGPGRFVLASPWARLLAHENGINLEDVTGTGPNGCVIGRDVLQYNRELRKIRMQDQNRAAHTQPSPEHTIPLIGIRRMIAERMTESLQTMAQATLNTEVDVTELLCLREQTAFQPEPTHMDVVIKAASVALKMHSQINAFLLGDEIKLQKEVNVGLAVFIQEGMLVPVVANADQRTLAEIAQETKRLTAAAHAGTLTVDEVAGGTFTVTDLGIYGVDFFVPIINPPETAILGVGRIVEKPVIMDDQVVARSMMILCLSFDHRVVDGAEAAAFLHTISQLLATPQQLFA